jgi:hypothetical protein
MAPNPEIENQGWAFDFFAIGFADVRTRTNGPGKWIGPKRTDNFSGR